MKKRRLGKNLAGAGAIQAIMIVFMLTFVNDDDNFQKFLIGTVVPLVFIVALGAWQIYVVKEHFKQKIESTKRKGR